MIAFKPIRDDDAALTASPVLKGALLTLAYIDANGPIGLTPAKALKRYFVQWAAEAFAWPHYPAEELYSINKVLNEPDFPPLMVLHDVLLSAKLVRHAKSAMHSTRLGKDLQTKPGELWALLTYHLLSVLDHGKYARYADQLMGNWDIFLNVINIEAQAGVSEGRLLSVLYGGSEETQRLDARLAAAMYIQVLRPLCWAGLLQENRNGERYAMNEIYTKTPLWKASLELETDRNLKELTRH